MYKTPTSKIIRYGELLGISQDHKLILEEHPEFQQLTAHSFDLFREEKEVIFLSEINSMLYERQSGK